MREKEEPRRAGRDGAGSDRPRRARVPRPPLPGPAAAAVPLPVSERRRQLQRSWQRPLQRPSAALPLPSRWSQLRRPADRRGGSAVAQEEGGGRGGHAPLRATVPKPTARAPSPPDARAGGPFAVATAVLFPPLPSVRESARAAVRRRRGGRPDRAAEPARPRAATPPSSSLFASVALLGVASGRLQPSRRRSLRCRAAASIGGSTTRKESSATREEESSCSLACR